MSTINQVAVCNCLHLFPVSGYLSHCGSRFRNCWLMSRLCSSMTVGKSERGGSPLGVKPWSLEAGKLGFDVFLNPLQHSFLPMNLSHVPISVVGFSEAQKEGSRQSLLTTVSSCWKKAFERRAFFKIKLRQDYLLPQVFRREQLRWVHPTFVWDVFFQKLYLFILVSR